MEERRKSGINLKAEQVEQRRLIESDFPLREVSEEASREKSIRHGHISTLHIWWARRPLAASRATTFAALTNSPDDAEGMRKRLQFVAELSKWENSNNQRMIAEARAGIRETFSGRTPKVLDLFAGGGAIPLESLRLGCDTYALDLNPVAVTLLRATIEYPQRYRRRNSGKENEFRDVSNKAPLVEDVERWGEWVRNEARKEIEEYYFDPEEKNIPVGYLWSRTITCQKPSCKAEIPLLRQLWLSHSDGREIALKIIPDKENRKTYFEIRRDSEIDFDPSIGTTQKTTIRCPVCDSAISAINARKALAAEKVGQRLIAVVSHNNHGKNYRISTRQDEERFERARSYLERKIKEWPWEFDPVPQERIPTPDDSYTGNVANTFFVELPLVIYGVTRWGDMFNARQKLAQILFLQKIRDAYGEMVKAGYEEDYAKAVLTYLALALDRLADYNSQSCVWATSGEFIAHTFGRQAIPMVWDYFELNPFSDSTGDWNSALGWITRVIQHCSEIDMQPAKVSQGTATKLPFLDNYFDAVITDPPYYDNVPYAILSDFFYVWLKRSLGELYPDLFATPQTPKSPEIIQNSSLARRWSDGLEAKLKDRDFFERELTKAFGEINRVLKSDGIFVLVFAHRSTEAWETVINSLLRSRFILISSWPLNTEMRARLTAKETAALASSVYMVCRKRGADHTAFYDEIKQQLENRIKERLEYFWSHGIRGADFLVSAIGPAVEIYSKFSRVEKLSGEEVSVQELLGYVRRVVGEFALERILKKPDLGGVDEQTRFYLLWRWMFNKARVHFDEARKLAQAVGLELADLWDHGGFVKKENEFIRVLDSQERAKEGSFSKHSPSVMIETLHRTLALWERGDRKNVEQLLQDSGFANNETFWQVTQAISEVLPQGDKEKQILQGFLYGKDTYLGKEAAPTKTLIDFKA